jgi:hypothetical protein
MKASLAAAAGTLAAVALIVGCSSSGTTAKPAAKVSTAPASGTETMTGQVTGAAAVANTTTFPLVLTGPVNTTGTITLPNSNSTHATITFKTKAGDLVAAAYAPDANSNTPPTVVDAAACRFKFTINATFTVTGAKSTGAFKDAHGGGKAAIVFEADAPKLSNGKCNMSNNAQPLTNGALGTFHSSGPLTVN